MRVRFSKPYDYTPSGERRITIAYLPDGGADGDGEFTVKRECGEAAIKAGAAEEVDSPSRDDAED